MAEENLKKKGRKDEILESAAKINVCNQQKRQEKWPSRLPEILLIKIKRKRKRITMFRTFGSIKALLKESKND